MAKKRTTQRAAVVRVLSSGRWTERPALAAQITTARWEDLVLSRELGERLREDVARYVAARAELRRRRVAWKRGLLFVGPTGTGKTLAMRTVARELGTTVLYVDDFVAPRASIEGAIADAFERARAVAPCVIVLEDLEALVPPSARHALEHALDASADGIVVLASTRRPELLDAGLVDRPGRFDRIYRFAAPTESERRRYAESWNRRLGADLTLDPTALDGIAATTDGFSFAYLEELFASALMRAATGTIDAPHLLDALREETSALRHRMKTTNVVPVASA